MKILDLPFVERPVLELLHFDDDRVDVDRTYGGYGWARVPRVHLGTKDGGALEAIDDALVLALHSADRGEPLATDVELEFELPAGEPVTVLASQFLEQWLPRLPNSRAIVLAMCNPHGATLRVEPPTGTAIYYATGDAESWIDDANAGRIEILADGSWATVAPR